MKAFLNLRLTVLARRVIFTRGLERLGYTVVDGITTRPGDRDILVTWNRIREAQHAANVFEGRGLPVIVTENATWGNSFKGSDWYTLTRNYHNTAGRFPIGDAVRWDMLRVDLQPFRTGGETVLLPQRGIGPPTVAMPHNWIDKTLPHYPGARVRRHPGQLPCKPLLEDLATAGHVVTWGSGAAIMALMQGIRVQSQMPNWIGQQDNTEEGRLAMFRRLAWAQARLTEIESGEALARILAR